MPGLQNQFVRILVQCKPITAIAVSRALLNPLLDAAGLVTAPGRKISSIIAFFSWALLQSRWITESLWAPFETRAKEGVPNILTPVEDAHPSRKWVLSSLISRRRALTPSTNPVRDDNLLNTGSRRTADLFNGQIPRRLIEFNPSAAARSPAESDICVSGFVGVYAPHAHNRLPFSDEYSSVLSKLRQHASDITIRNVLEYLSHKTNVTVWECLANYI
jgi:hypothetical protein